MTRKSLWSWYQVDDITYSQREVIEKFGVGDYYPERELWDFKKLWYWDEILERNKEKINIPGQIEKMIFFSADWNNNLIIVVSKEGNEWITNLIVYEMPMQSGDVSTEILEKIELLDGRDSRDMNKVYEKERKLTQCSNPIFIYSMGIDTINSSGNTIEYGYRISFGLTLWKINNY